MKILYRGAEAVLTLDKRIVEGEERDVVIKERISKGYRIKVLDDVLRSRRTKREESLLRKARSAGVMTPRIFDSDRFRIVFEFLDGPKVKDALNGMDGKNREGVYRKIGESIGRLHSYNMIHGDLTTSNMIILGKDVYFIDFGLGKLSSKEEDKAMDLYLLYEALKSTHFMILDEAWESVISFYKKQYPQAGIVLDRLEKIEKRHRYKA